MLNNLFEHLSLKRNIYLSREELDLFRFILLKKQLLHAYQNIPYYKMAFNKAGVNPSNFRSIEDLSSYPIITKDIIRLNNSQFLNRKVLFQNRLKSHTSGSTGQPMWTYYDMKSWIRKKYLVKARARMECGTKFNERIVIFETSSPEQTEQRNKRFLSRSIFSRVKVFSMFEPLEQTFKSLYYFSPQSLYGSPSYFFQLAQVIEKNNSDITSIKRIFTSSEYLQENVRNYIEKIFNAIVYDVYGSTEFKEVAWECDKPEGYHINEDEVIIEVVQDGKPVPFGVIGNIVITDLRNKAMPLIRYQMYDKGMLIDEKCSCGRTFALMAPYAGRSSEYIILPNEEILSPYLFTTNIEKINGLIQYQVVQTTKEKIVVSIVTNSEDFSRIDAAIKSILTNITNHLMEIEVQQNTKIDIEENGKFKVVKNLILE